MNDFKQLDNFFGAAPEKKKREYFLPTKEQFYYLPRLLSAKERWLVIGLMVIALASLIAIPVSAYRHNTVESAAYGGSWSEGMVGAPQHINPLLLQSNDTDSDLSSLIYAGLLRYDGNGKLVPELAESYTISDDGLQYTFKLKPDLRWHDGQTLTADDVVFTILTAQNSDYASTQRVNWQGFDVAKLDDMTVVFKLKNRYAQFLGNITIGIIPKHIWETVKASNFAIADQNLKPIGAGPYSISKTNRDGSGKIKSIELSAFDKYASGKPYIDHTEFFFYESEKNAIDAYNSGDIDGLSLISTQNINLLRSKRNTTIHHLRLPRYFALFFNQNKSKSLSDKNVRLALNYATDKETMLKGILGEDGSVVDSPLLPGIIDIPEISKKYSYDVEKAKSLLEKQTLPLEIEITISGFPELIAITEQLKTQWEKIGIKAIIKTLSISDVQQAIKEREYQTLLYGEVLGLDPDPFSFWHSSQKKDPGLNLALYDNKDADKIL